MKNYKFDDNVRYEMTENQVKAYVSLIPDGRIHEASRYAKTNPFVIQTVFTGIATRKENDKLDLETAKKIAKKKAIRSAYYYIANLNREAQENLQKKMNMFYDYEFAARKKGKQIDSNIVKTANKKKEEKQIETKDTYYFLIGNSRHVSNSATLRVGIYDLYKDYLIEEKPQLVNEKVKELLEDYNKNSVFLVEPSFVRDFLPDYYESLQNDALNLYCDILYKKAKELNNNEEIEVNGFKIVRKDSFTETTITNS